MSISVTAFGEHIPNILVLVIVEDLCHQSDFLEQILEKVILKRDSEQPNESRWL